MDIDAMRRLRELAARQHWAFAIRQAKALGISSGQLARLVRDGHCERVHQLVLRFAGGEASRLQSIAAAVLAGGDGAVASHRSAASVWGIEAPVAPPEITVPRARHPFVPGVCVYRSKTLRRADAGLRLGIPVTSPARTMLDLAAVLDELDAELALDHALRLGQTGVDSLNEFLDRPELIRAAGSGVLRGLVSFRTPGRPIGGFLATRFFRMVRLARFELPTPEYAVMTPGGVRYIDFAYPEHKLAVEVDDYASHGSRLRFDGDRIRRWELLAMGWRVFEVTATAMREPRDVLWRLATLLGEDLFARRRRPRGSPPGVGRAALGAAPGVPSWRA